MRKTWRAALRDRQRICAALASASLFAALPCYIMRAEGRVSKPQEPTADATTRVVFFKSCRSAKSSRQVSEILQALSTHPSAGAYNTLGALFAQQNDFACAIPAFEAALRLEPNSVQPRFNLAVALAQNDKQKQAADHLRILVRQKPDFFAAHNALGLVLQDLGELDGAEEEFRGALKINPRFTFAASNLAKLLHSQKRYPAEIFYLRQALASDPPEKLAHQLQLDLGAAYEFNGDTDHAIEFLRTLVASYPKSADVHFALATVYAKHVRFKEAKAEYEEAVRLDPEDNVARISLAKILTELGENAAALPHFQVYTRRVPADYEGHLVMGAAYRRLGDLTQAARELRRAVELKPDSYEARYNLGFVLAHSEHLEEGIEQLEAAKKLNPHAAEAPYELSLIFKKKNDPQRAEEEVHAFQEAKRWSDRESNAAILGSKANALLEKGDTEGAVAMYIEVIELEPDNPKTHYNLALALEKLGKRGEESQELEKAVELDPNFAEAHNQLGILRLANGRGNDAEREFRTALAINPEYAEAENGLANVYVHQGKIAEAVSLFRKATEHDPKNARAYLDWGLVLAGQGHYAGAEELFRKAIGLSPNNTDAYTTLGMIEAKLGHLKESIPLFRKVLELQPDSADAHVNLGIALADQYDLRGALEQFTEAVRLAPNSPSAHYNRGRALYDLGKRQEARTELEAAYRLSPEYSSVLYLLALLERQASDYPRSTALFEKLVSLEPKNSVAHYLLGQDLLHLGKQEEAIHHLQLAVEADPNNSQALYNLAQTLSKAGKPEAKLYMDRFQALQKSRKLSDRVQTLNNFALEAANSHNWPQAVEQLKEALELCGQCPQLPVLHKNLGLIYARTGDPENGEQELRLALRLNPNDPDASKAIGIIEESRNNMKTTAN